MARLDVFAIPEPLFIKKHLFGPVPSRRLVMSLGIDLIPKKVCSIDCVYCEVGKTTKLTIDRMEFVKYDQVIAPKKASYVLSVFRNATERPGP